MHTRLMKLAALAAALTVPLVLVALAVLLPSRLCENRPGGPPCATVLPDVDGALLWSTAATAVVELLFVGIAAALLGASRGAALTAIAVVPPAVAPVAAAAAPWFAVISLACPALVLAVRRVGGRGAGIAVTASLLPSILWALPWDEGLGLPTGFVVLSWLVSVPVAFLAPRLEAGVDRL